MLKEPLMTEAADRESKMQGWRNTVFVITFVNYAMAHVATSLQRGK